MLTAEYTTRRSCDRLSTAYLSGVLNGESSRVRPPSWPHSIVEIARRGYRATGELLSPFVALLSRELTEIGDTPG